MSSIKRVGVVGSGAMGAGIAEVATSAGFEVVLRSRAQKTADKAVDRVAKSLGSQVEKGKLDAGERDAAVDRLRGVTDLGELEMCDLVVESVVEELEVKQDLFRQLDGILPDQSILATNTSTLPVVELAATTERPERVLGLHFFNPAPKMPLVEIIPALTTADDVVAAARQFAQDCGKNPVVAKDKAGFIVNALLFPYLNGAVQMLESGVASKEDIDEAMKGGCGFPMGPLELLDLIGLDTSVSVLNALSAEHPDPAFVPVPLLKRMVAANQLGRKTGQGFYSYDDNGN